MLKIVKIALERNTEISACCCQEALARMRTCLLTRYSAPGVGYGIYLVSNYPMKIKESTWRYDKHLYWGKIQIFTCVTLSCNFKGELQLKLKLNVLCMLSQNYQYCFEKSTALWSKLSEKLKIGIKILVGQVVLELLKTICCVFCEMWNKVKSTVAGKRV